MLVSHAVASPPGLSDDGRFVARVYRLRIAGLGLGALAVASVLVQNGAVPVVWALLLCHAVLWPHLARALAKASAIPKRTELRNLLIDSAIGGCWVALMRFNLLPSVLLLTMLAVDKINVGGWRLLGRAMLGQLAGCAATAGVLWMIDGAFPWQPVSTMVTVVASLPYLVVYPLLIGAATHALSRHVRRHNRELVLTSTVDAATRLWNRATWQKALDVELRRLHRYSRSAALLMIDIDHFKQINDSLGHLTGDDVIVMVATAIRDSVRDVDVPCRYGGDEFGVLLPHTGEHAATLVAERIRARVASATLTGAPGLRCTLSIGIATANRDMPNAGEWIARADAGLYRAKMLGRNRSERGGVDRLQGELFPPFTQS